MKNKKILILDGTRIKPFFLNNRAIFLAATTLTTGLLAGIFFTWTNAVTPGIGRLDDLSYLKAFQNMNRAIINPLFYVVIIGPLLLLPWTFYLYKSSYRPTRQALLGATTLYYLGVFAVTMIGNIPLNILLEKAPLDSIGLDAANNLRKAFEQRWNGYHLIRTITSAASFLLLILACLSGTDDKNIIHQSI